MTESTELGFIFDERNYFTFEPRDYIKFMPYDLTDQFAGRRHICPICGRRVWSCFGWADRHWQQHEEAVQLKRQYG